MGSLFDIDGGIMGALGKVADIFILSIIFVVFSIPIFTMGASFTALYYTSVKAIRRGRSYIWKSFWKSFKENFGKATILWLGILLLGGILCLNIWYAMNLGQTLGYVLLCIYCMMMFVLLITGAYVFPILSRFNLTKRYVLRNSFFMAVRHLPFSILMLVILAGVIAAFLFLAPAIFFMPALGAVIYSFPMERILKKYTKSSGNENDDEWYLE